WSSPSTPPVPSTLRIWVSTCAALGCPRCCSLATPPLVWSKAACGMPETRITTVSWCETAAPPRLYRSTIPAWTLSFPVWHGWPVWMRLSTPSGASLHSDEDLWMKQKFAEELSLRGVASLMPDETYANRDYG